MTVGFEMYHQKSKIHVFIDLIRYIFWIGVVLALSYLSLHNVIDGPLNNYLQDRTIMQKNELNISGRYITFC